MEIASDRALAAMVGDRVFERAQATIRFAGKSNGV